MKVLHAAETIRGGVATVIQELVCAHRSSDAISVLCLVPSDQKVDLPEVPEACLRYFDRRRRGLAGFAKLFVAFFQIVWAERPDIVHLHSTFAGVAGRLALAFLWPFRRPRVVYCPHGWSFLMRVSSSKARAYALIERALLWRTDRIVCVSEFEREEAFRHGLVTKKIRVVHNGVREAPPNDHIDPYQVAAGTLRLLFVGRFDEQKGFDILLDAMKELEGSDIHLTAVGAAVNSDAQWEPTPNVHLAGWRSGASLAAYYAHADVVVVPSRWEGFAMVPLEAMSYGKPLVTSTACSLPEVLLDGETGFHFSGGAAELTQTLRGLPREQLSVLGKKGRAHFEDNFRASAMAEKTETIYRELME